MLKKALLAVSLANLCFIPEWRKILDPGSQFHYFYFKNYPGWAVLAAITLNTLLLSALFFGGYLLARRSRRPLVQRAASLAFILLTLFVVNVIRVQIDALQFTGLAAALGRAGGVALGLVACLLVALVFWRFGLARLTQAAMALILILSPFVVVAYTQAVWLAFRYQAAFDAGHSLAPPLAPGPRTRARVLWVIFDEFDQRAAFANRPPALELPEFDRMRTQALVADNAYPPASWTNKSVPALVTGRLVSAVEPVSPDDLALKFHESEQQVGWKTQPNIFSGARELGYNAVVVGWAFPYCRMFSRLVTACSWEPIPGVPERHSLSHHMLRQARESFLSVPLVHRVLPKPPPIINFHNKILGEFVEHHRGMMGEALKMVVDPGPGITLVHFMVPHPPSFYDRARGEVSTTQAGSYLDGLALADRSLGELRRALESAGVWDNTTVLVSSDHWWRTTAWDPAVNGGKDPIGWTAEDAAASSPVPDYRVPFILKMAGQGEGVVHESAFNTVLSKDLLLAVLRGEVSTAADASKWIDEHRSIVESPYYDLSPSPTPKQ